MPLSQIEVQMDRDTLIRGWGADCPQPCNDLYRWRSAAAGSSPLHPKGEWIIRYLPTDLQFVCYDGMYAVGGRRGARGNRSGTIGYLNYAFLNQNYDLIQTTIKFIF